MSDEKCEPKIRSDAEKLNPDLIYEEIGGFGKFQIFVYVLICLPLIFVVCCNFSYIFIADEMEYRCFIPECEADSQNNSSAWIFNAIPYVDGKVSKCDRFTPLWLNNTNGSECPWKFNHSDAVQCEKFVYLTHEHNLLNEVRENDLQKKIKKEIKRSFNQFNLTCETNQWKLTLVGSLAYLAECMASPFIGLIADRYGRQPTLIGSIIFVSIFGIAKTFSPNYLTFIVLHFIGAIFGAGVFSLVFVFGSEVVGPNSRALGAAIISNGVSVGQILLAVMTMYIVDFRILLRCLFGMVALTLTFVWLVPESVRWLFSVGRHKEGCKIIEKVAKINGTKISVDTMTVLSKHYKNDLLLADCNNHDKKTETHQMVTALKSKVLLIRLFNCSYCYFTNALIYFGLSVYSSTLPGDKHMNLMYAGIVELPGNTAVHYVLKRYGRKWSLIITMIVCSIACIGSELMPNASMKIIFFLVGKFAVALSYTILNIYSIELFPTNLRQSMFSICMIFGGCGTMMAPQLPLLKIFMPSLPLILFSGTSFSSALLLLLLPETRNKSMPDTVEEAINI